MLSKGDEASWRLSDPQNGVLFIADVGSSEVTTAVSKPPSPYFAVKRL